MGGRIDRKYYTGYLSGVADGLNQGRQDTIAELEKIKAEIMSIGNWREHYEMPIAYLSCLTIVEHHIAELKGE